MRLVKILLLFIFALDSYALAADKITVDPNAKQLSDSAMTVVNHDVLAKKITYQARRKTVAAVLDDLSKLSGVNLRAGFNQNDWQVRDRKVCVFANDVPLAALMNSISHVLLFKWSKSEGDNGVIYRLYQNRETMRALLTKQLAEDARIRQEQMNMRESVLQDLSSAAVRSGGDMAAFKETDPYTYFLSSVGVASSLDDLLNSAPSLRDAFVRGEQLSLDALSLEGHARDSLTNTINDLWKMAYVRASNRDSSYSNPILPDNLREQLLDAAVITINPGAGSSDPAGGNVTLGQVSIELPGKHISEHTQSLGLGVTLYRPDSWLAKFHGNLWTEALEHPDKSVRDLQKDLVAKSFPSQEEIRKDLKIEQMGDPVVQHEHDTFLDKEVDISDIAKPKLSYEDIFLRLSETAGVAVVTDSFGAPVDYTAAAGKVTINDVLARAEMNLNSNWWRNDLVIEIRDRMWLKKRINQLPEDLLTRWRDSIKTSAGISLDVVAEICTLSEEQYKANIAGDERLGFLNAVAQNYNCNKDVMGFYARLDSRQRRMLMTDDGLAIGQLSPELRAVAYKFVRDPKLIRNNSDPSDWRLRLQKRDGNGGTNYVFKLAHDGEDGSMVWLIQL